jgi:NAD(P)-dependent dehydrogenase (short-subunit alcohol dehydrogenase family)
MKALKDKVAIVTGSSRGIGAAIARLFAQEGAKVVVHGRDANAMSSVQAEIGAAGGKAMQVAADVTSFAEIEAMRHKIEGEFGPVEILVANAGGSYTLPGPLEDVGEAGWHASVDGNLTATFLTIKSFLPGMKERRAGNIITLSTAAARRPHPGSPIPYPGCRRPGWRLWHSGQLHRARIHPHRAQPTTHTRCTETNVSRSTPHQTPGHAGGRGTRSIVSRFGRGGLDHRHPLGCRWRVCPGLSRDRKERNCSKESTQ